MPTVARLARELDGGRAVDAGGGTIDSLPANGLQAHRGWGDPAPLGRRKSYAARFPGLASETSAFERR
jgi:hypothetical protein